MLDLDDEALGVDLAVEGLVSLPAGRVAVACPVGDLAAPEALLDVGHWSAVLSPGPLGKRAPARGGSRDYEPARTDALVSVHETRWNNTRLAEERSGLAKVAGKHHRWLGPAYLAHGGCSRNLQHHAVLDHGH